MLWGYGNDDPRRPRMTTTTDLQLAIATEAPDATLAELADELTAGEIIRALNADELAQLVAAVEADTAWRTNQQKIHGGPCPHGGCGDCDL